MSATWRLADRGRRVAFVPPIRQRFIARDGTSLVRPRASSWWGVVCLAALVSCAPPRAADRAPASQVPLTIGLPSAQVDVGPLVRILTTQVLVGTGPDGRPTPGLLQSWTTSPDGRVWTFTLTPDVRRHDGGVVTADDLAAIIRDQEDPPPGLLDVDRLEVIGPAVLRIHLRQPSSLLLEALTLTRAVSAGPFVPGSAPIERDSSPTLPASANGKTAPTAIDRVAFRRYESPRAAWAALMRDEIDLLHEVSGEARPFLEQAAGIEVRPFLRPFVVTLGLNVRHPALRHRDVRLALNHAVDRADLLARDFGGRGLAAATPVWPRHWAADASVHPHTFDRVLARRLLETAGYRRTDRADGRPSRLRLTCLIREDIPRLERVALRVRRAYADVGIDLVLEPLGDLEFMDRLATGRFETFLITVMSGHGPNALVRMWGRHGRTRDVDHGYAAAVEAAEQVRRAHTDVAMREALPALQRVLLNDPPAVFLVWEEMARAVGRRFVVPPSPGRDILSTLPQWRPRAAEIDS